MIESAPGVWTRSITLPSRAYVEYAFLVDGERALDPSNPRTTPNGLGDTNNFLYMPGAGPTALARRIPGVPCGVVRREIIEVGDLIVGRKRAVYWYHPPVAEPCPLLVVFDGGDYLRRAHLDVIVDNLIAQGRIRPIALAMVDNSRAARFIEYACSEATVDFLASIVLPLARQRLNVIDVGESPGAYGVMGASMGGLMALYTALRAPGIFGRVLSQSGAFNIMGHDMVVFDLIRCVKPKPIQVWMDAGKLEELLACNRRLRRLLKSAGYDVAYREYGGGHNYPAWRDDLPRGLTWLFGTQGA